ncbi:MAG: ATP-binding protein, partial [Christensenellaceae bacterium]
TSPETRFQVPEPKQKDTYTKSFSFNKETIPLCAGINVIIGENGAGKSSLLSLFLDPNSRKTWIQKFKKANEVEIPCTLDESKSVIVSQGELRKRYDQDALISSARYSPVSHEAFEEKVTAFTNAIKQTMLLNIQRRQNDNQLQQSVLKIHPELEIETFDIGVSVSGDFSTVDNPHKERLTALNKIADGIQAELDSHYYDKESVEQLAQAKTAIESVIKKIQAKNDEIELEIEAKSLIYLAIEEYKSNCSIHKTDRDNEVSGYRENQRLFIKTILDKAKDVITPDIQIPKIILGEYDGVSSNTSNGFTFVKTAAYREDSNIEDSLLSLLFNQGLSSLEAIRKLDEQTKVTNAVRGASKGNWETKWEENISKYKEAAEKVTPSIHDQRQNQPLGNTLGEQSLTFYKYKTYNSADWETMFLDQPEDDISQSRIHGDLIEYFNRIRGNHQLVLVTHNPLLVVNQDVDNVIVINKERGSTKILSGCLESPGILEEVAEHMDGGRRAIEKRLKAYGPERMGKNE